jgi:hypothetical protein
MSIWSYSSRHRTRGRDYLAYRFTRVIVVLLPLAAAKLANWRPFSLGEKVDAQNARPDEGLRAANRTAF